MKFRNFLRNLIVLLTLISSYKVQSKTRFGFGVDIPCNIHYNIKSFSGLREATARNTTGIVPGAFTEISLSKLWNIEAGVAYEYARPVFEFALYHSDPNLPNPYFDTRYISLHYLQNNKNGVSPSVAFSLKAPIQKNSSRAWHFRKLRIEPIYFGSLYIISTLFGT